MVKTVVVDSSIVIKWFVVESYSTEAFHLLDRYQNGELTLLAPDLLYAEIGNIVWKKHRLQGISTTDAQQIIETFCQLSIELTPHGFRGLFQIQKYIYNSSN
jgi:predicted nucleic acid-binding protein